MLTYVEEQLARFQATTHMTPPQSAPTYGNPVHACSIRQPGDLLYDPFTPRHNTNYASPRVQDPIDAFRLSHWIDPSKEQMKAISFALSHLASVQRITYVWKLTIVELEVDGRTYEPRSLPGIVAGCTSLYHHSSDSYWRGMSRRRRWIVPDPTMDIQDVTNYLTVCCDRIAKTASELHCDPGIPSLGFLFSA